MVTQDQVNEICASLQARGERPTVDRVRAELGGGSPNALTPLVRIWRESQGQKGLEAPPPAAPIEPGTLPTAIQRAIDALTVAVTNLGPAFSQAVADVAETERRRSRLEVESAAAGARAQVAEARLAAEDERAATDSVRAEVLELEAAIGAKDAEARQLADALAARDQVLAERAAEVERLAGRIEQERAARAEADTRLAELQDQGTDIPQCRRRRTSHRRGRRCRSPTATRPGHRDGRQTGRGPGHDRGAPDRSRRGPSGC